MLTAMMCDQGKRDKREILVAQKKPGEHRGCARAEQGTA